jgi:hypothetical protein
MVPMAGYLVAYLRCAPTAPWCPSPHSFALKDSVHNILPGDIARDGECLAAIVEELITLILGRHALVHWHARQTPQMRARAEHCLEARNLDDSSSTLLVNSAGSDQVDPATWAIRCFMVRCQVFEEGSLPRSMGLLGVARLNTAVGVSPETFLLLLIQNETPLTTAYTSKAE